MTTITMRMIRTRAHWWAREIRLMALFVITCYAQAFAMLLLLTALYGLWCHEWIGAAMVAGCAVPLYLVYRVADFFLQRCWWGGQ